MLECHTHTVFTVTARHPLSGSNGQVADLIEMDSSALMSSSLWSREYLEYISSVSNPNQVRRRETNLRKYLCNSRRWSFVANPLKKSNLIRGKIRRRMGILGLGGGTGAEMTSISLVEIRLWCRIA